MPGFFKKSCTESNTNGHYSGGKKKNSVSGGSPSPPVIPVISGGLDARRCPPILEDSATAPFVLKMEDETFGQPFRRGRETRAEQTVN